MHVWPCAATMGTLVENRSCLRGESPEPYRTLPSLSPVPPRAVVRREQELSPRGRTRRKPRVHTHGNWCRTSPDGVRCVASVALGRVREEVG